MQEILLNIETKEIRYAHLKNGQLFDLVVERKKSRQLTGNIYRGKVTNILHNIQSAFIDIAEGENGFIHISDILENTKKFEDMFEMDFDLAYDKQQEGSKKTPSNIEEIMKIDQPVLVQVVKEPIGSKGARLTSNVSIAGRYLVLLPSSPHRGVSRKIEDRGSRERLKNLIRAFEMPQEMGLICRTASTDVEADILIKEAGELLKIWQSIMENFNKATGPSCLWCESDLIKRAVMTAIDKKLDRILIDDYKTFQLCKRLYSKYATEHDVKIELYRDSSPLFERFNVEKDLEKALRHKIWLPSGGYLFFDHTEAMHTIDVNSGRSSKNTNDVEETLVRINIEAAEEISRQLRIRNIGGLVICDFIDMRSRKNQRRVLEKMKDCMKDDSAKCTLGGMSEFGLVEMTRQRSRESLQQTLFTGCPYCIGSGVIKTHETISIEIERSLKKVILFLEKFALSLFVHPSLFEYITKEDKDYWICLAEKSNAHLEINSDDTLHMNDYYFVSRTDGKKIEI
ncbi:MAG: Rne/Rng family ribonuclease [Chlamydiae bacterium]|nr:Rne/Rng family ribonuclease [Chlamydiota bacterium]